MLAKDIVADLSRELPPAVLLLGHPPVLEELARQVLIAHGLRLSDLRFCRKLNAEAARAAVAEANVHPDGDFLGFVLTLDSSTSEQAQNILLKLVEEPPSTVRIILISPRIPLPALVSRCPSYRVHDAEPAEPVEDDNSNAAAAAAVRAALTRDPAALAEALRPWGEKCGCKAGKPHDKGEHYVAALSRWAVSQYRPGAPDARTLGPAVNPVAARTVLRVLSDYSRARSQNVAAAALSLAFLEDT